MQMEVVVMARNEPSAAPFTCHPAPGMVIGIPQIVTVWVG